MVTIMTAFGCVALCVAEMTAALPFSGGTYGVVRVTLGDLAGYLIGTTETFQYILYVAFNIVAMGSYVTTMTGYDAAYEPLYWVVIYSVIIVVLTFHKTLYWHSMTVLGAYICVMILLYCTMTREGADFADYSRDSAATDVPLGDRVLRFFQYLPHGSWFFGLAAKIMPLACVETVNPTVNVPRAIYYSYALAIVSAFCIVFSAASIRPGVAVLRTSSAPLTFGFSQMFRIPFERAIAFTLVAKFATCLCFSFAYSTQIAALSRSGFMWRAQHSQYIPERYSEFVSILTGCLIGYAMMIIIWYWDKDYKVYLQNGYLLLGYSINVVLFVTYISFRYKFRSLVKQYESPVGIPGAVYGSVVFAIVFVSVGALQQADRYTYFVLLVVFMVLWTVPYYAYYRHHVVYSEEEGTILFIAYVIRANVARRARKLHKMSPAASISLTGSKKPPHGASPKQLKYRGESGGSQEGSDHVLTTQQTSTALTAARVVEPDLEVMSVNSYTAPRCRSSSEQQAPPEIPVVADTSIAARAVAAKKKDSIATVRLPYMELPLQQLPGMGTSGRIAPSSARDTAEQRSRRVAGVDSVLLNEFQYEGALMGAIRSELQEFYDNGGAAAEDDDPEP
jgi:ethanolamine permease